MMKLRIGNLALLAVACYCLVGCCTQTETLFDTIYYKPEFAQGFEIVGMKGGESRVIRLQHSWQGDVGRSGERDVFIARGNEAPPKGFSGQVIRGDVKRVVAMSSSYIAIAEMIGEVEKIVGVSGLRFVNNTYIREHAGGIVDVGPENNVDYERLAAVRPDLVLLYGLNSASPMEERLRELAIPYLYVGEYLEEEPLGRAEWVVALAEAFGCRSRGEEVFDGIRSRYLELKGEVKQFRTTGIVEREGEREAGIKAENGVVGRIECGEPKGFRPKVMLNVPYGDIWYMPSVNSAIARLIEDAGGEYIYRENISDASLPLDFEKAFLLASEADFWLNVGQYASIEALTEAFPVFANVACVHKHKVYNCDLKVNANGGNDFWESGLVRPDLVLEDMIRIFHPELSVTQLSSTDLTTSTETSVKLPQTFHYYRQLQ